MSKKEIDQNQQDILEDCINLKQEQLDDKIFLTFKQLEEYTKEKMLPFFNIHGHFINYYDFNMLIHNNMKESTK